MLDFMLSRLQSDVNPRALKELLNRLQNGRARSQLLGLGRQGDSSTRTSEAIVLTMHRTTKVKRQDVFRRNALDVIGKRKMEFGIRKEIKRVV
ncbi:hypothetical protein PVAP13_J683218 [Panicum virgatum]|nr:hypothetical protein PVAP13_J683218 [Panicum virgatum]